MPGIGTGLIVAGGSMMASNIMSAAGVDGKIASIISSGLNIIAGVVLCATGIGGPLGASLIGSGVGAIGGGYISEAIGFGFEAGAMIGGIVGGIVGGQVYKGLSAATSKVATTVPKVAEVPDETAVIGKMSDLNKYKLQPGEYKLADRLRDMGSPKANWKLNSGVLRSAMRTGNPIKDISVNSAGNLINNTGFLRAERYLLQSRGWLFSNGYWSL